MSQHIYILTLQHVSRLMEQQSGERLHHSALSPELFHALMCYLRRGHHMSELDIMPMSTHVIHPLFALVPELCVCGWVAPKAAIVLCYSF